MDPVDSAFQPLFALSLLGFILITAGVSIARYRRQAPALGNVGGSLVLGASIRGWYYDNLLPFEDICVRWGISPAALSYTQLAASVLVAACYASGWLFTGGWLLLFTGTLDIIDGRVARRTNTGTARGAFLDSVIDRYADAFGYVGLAVYFRASWVLWAVLLASVGGVMTSYTRARAEGLGAECRVGLLQRPERYVILGFGTIFGALWEHISAPWLPAYRLALVVLTIVGLAVAMNVTALQRVVHVWRALGADDV